MTVVEKLTAFMKDPDKVKPNPIHSTSTAREYGYQGALVGGVTAYGWTVATVVKTLGHSWLDSGWAEIHFKRPIYPGDELEVIVDEQGALAVKNSGSICFSGKVGLGDAPWRNELTESNRVEAEPSPDPTPSLTPENVPVGQDLAGRRVALSRNQSVEFCRDRQHERLECFYANPARVHPSWIAGQAIHWLHHSYSFGPSIHTRSRIQHLHPAYAGQDFIVTGRCIDAYQKRQHEYIVCDIALRDGDGTTSALVRHTSIYQVANKRGRAAS